MIHEKKRECDNLLKFYRLVSEQESELLDYMMENRYSILGIQVASIQFLILPSIKYLIQNKV